MSELDTLKKLMDGIMNDIKAHTVVGPTDDYIDGFKAGESFMVDCITKNGLKILSDANEG